jgi:Ala-tRNA(Pro) deacylase
MSLVLVKIKKLLDEAHIVYELLEHDPVYTSEEAARIRDSNLSMGAKALVLFGDKQPLLVVVPGDKKLNMKEFKRIFGIKDLRMATPDEVFSLTGVKVGAVPPVGKALNLKSYYDESFKSKDKVAFNAGMHTVSIIMQAADLIRLEDPVFGNIIG